MPVPGQGAVAPQGLPPEDPQFPSRPLRRVPPSPPLLQGTAVPTPPSTTLNVTPSDDIALACAGCAPRDVPKNYLDVAGPMAGPPPSTGPGAAIGQEIDTVTISDTEHAQHLNTPHTIAKKERTVYRCHYRSAPTRATASST